MPCKVVLYYKGGTIQQAGCVKDLNGSIESNIPRSLDLIHAK